MSIDELAASNALVAANVREAIKKAAAARELLVPAVLLRKSDQPAMDYAIEALRNKVDAEVLAMAKIHNPHKVHNRSTGEWRVEDDDGHVYGKFDSESAADKQLAALYTAKEKE